MTSVLSSLFGTKPKSNPVCGYKTDEFVNHLLYAFDLRLMKPDCGYMITKIDAKQLNNTSIEVTVEYGIGSHTGQTLGPKFLIHQTTNDIGKRTVTMYDVQYECSLSEWTIKSNSPSLVIMSTTLTYMGI